MGPVCWSRRHFLGAIPASAAVLPSELKRFRDAATEFELVRLTDPQWASHLPPAHLRAVSRGNQLLFCSDRGAGPQAFRTDPKSGDLRDVSEGGVDPQTLSFLPGDARLIYFRNGALATIGSGGGRERILYKPAEGWRAGSEFSLAPDGRYCAWNETSEAQTRLRALPLFRAANPVTIASAIQPAAAIRLRPRRTSAAFLSESAWWLAGFDGTKRRLALADAPAGDALWSQDGRTLLYLSYPQGRLHQIREHNPDTGEDKLIAPTSQFVRFARNGDGSVFAGVSRNKASPHVLLLLRTTRREFTLCEHHATDPSKTPVLFSPNSQRIFFETDRHGKPVIYSMTIDRIVEETEEEERNREESY